MKRSGRILATKLGYNPNSSSLGVDVTFFLVGASALAVVGPVVAGMLYLRRLRAEDGDPSTKEGRGANVDAGALEQTQPDPAADPPP